jgi:replication factor C subunit 3/5
MSEKPWIEKYRPTHFDNIVLDSINRRLFRNMIDSMTFPHLLFYGPPGTGKTTTITNLIQEYQTRRQILNSGNIIHLNASDERGIDIIRNQIQQFVTTKNLFDVGLKFVVLDEVDYMTKNAQQALKELVLSTTIHNVRYCLICNYISKIDTSLQDEFLCIRFNQLPQTDVFQFIQTICQSEQIVLEKGMMEKMHQMYGSDIRSMINFLQSNYGWGKGGGTIQPLHMEVFRELLSLFLSADVAVVREFVVSTCQTYQCDVRYFFLLFFHHVLRFGSFETNQGLQLLETMETLVHSQNIVPLDVLLSYFCHMADLFVGIRF